MRFAELQAGQVLEFGDHIVSEGEILEFAARYDPQPFHVDKTAAERSRWNGLIASGWHTGSLAMRMVADHVLRGSESMGSPGLDYVKWPHPVHPGDRLHMRMQILEASVSKTSQVGVIRWQWLLLNQNDEPVLDLIATSLFARDNAQSAGA